MSVHDHYSQFGELLSLNEVYVYPAVEDFALEVTAAGVEVAESNKAWRPWLWNVFPSPRIDSSRRHELQTQNQPARLNGTWFYVGPVRPHFGHLLLESTNRLWALEVLREANFRIDGLLLLPQSESRIPEKLVRSVLKVFGFDSTVRIEHLKSLTQVETLVVAQPGRVQGQRKFEWYKEFLAGKLENLADSNMPKKIFVSRRSYSYRGRLSGMDYLAEALGSSGYEEIMPEKYSLESQLKIIYNAEEVVWEEGSAIHLLELIPRLQSSNTLIRRRSSGILQDVLLEVVGPGLGVWSSVETVSSTRENDPLGYKMPSFIPEAGIEEFCSFIKSRTGVSVNAATFLSSASFDTHHRTKVLDMERLGLENLRSASERLAEQECGIRTLEVIIDKGHIETPDDSNLPRFGLVIDTPKNKSRIPYHGDCVVEGWATFRGNSKLSVVTDAGESQDIERHVERPDVFRHFAGRNIFLESARVGFEVSVPTGTNFFDVVLEENGTVYASIRVQLRDPLPT